jgi:hypothetical protein
LVELKITLEGAGMEGIDDIVLRWADEDSKT